MDYSVYNRRQAHKPELFSRSVSPLPANYAVAMMYVPMQTNTEMFDDIKALECGTLFPCLNKPFAGSAANDKREAMLKKLSAVQFALWEMHLYLDTHPWDLAMLENHNRLALKYKQLKAEFEEKFCPLTAAKAQGVEWLKGPWPWEIEECDC